MDFFEHQDAARKRTGRLAALFLCAVFGIVLAVYLAASLIYEGVLIADDRQDGNEHRTAATQPHRPTLWHPGLLLVVAPATLAVIALGSLAKIAELRGGGRVVAESLGAALVPPDSDDPSHRRLLHIVEEMAIASGVPVPPVYVMESEKGINAFAAGYSPADAIVCVTRGSLDTLSRDELQGVMAHEFSHILHGDMRLNIRLIGVLSGVLLLGLIGWTVLRSLRHVRLGGGRSSGGKKGGGAVAIVVAVILFGLALIVIGFIGSFFGGLIKAAVSRQREFLADASAVQFTRYPGGIAGALKKIGGSQAGSRVGHPRTEEASHLFFGQAVTSALGGLMATHPPLQDRIRRIEPRWDGTYPRLDPVGTVLSETARGLDGRSGTNAAISPWTPPTSTERASAGSSAGPKAAPSLSTEAQSSLAARRAAALDTLARGGTLSAIGDPIAHAAGLLESLPGRVRSLVREPLGAQAMVLAMLVSRQPEAAAVQRQIMAARADARVHALVGSLAGETARIAAGQRLAVASLALSALRQMSPPQARRFREVVGALIAADDRVDLFEWSLGKVIDRHLGQAFGAAPRPIGRATIESRAEDARRLLSALAWVGHREEADARRAYGVGAAALRVPTVNRSIAARAECGFGALDLTLDRLSELDPMHKRRLIDGLCLAALSDRAVTTAEVELLRAVAETLGVPMPTAVAMGQTRGEREA